MAVVFACGAAGCCYLVGMHRWLHFAVPATESAPDEPVLLPAAAAADAQSHLQIAAAQLTVF